MAPAPEPPRPTDEARALGPHLHPTPRAATMAPVTSPEPCARCGGDSDVDIASLWLCLDCYHVAGSTCAGIGRLPAAAPSPGPVPHEARARDAGADLGPVDQVC